MPVSGQGRFAMPRPEDPNQWRSREAGGQPVRLATESTDLAGDLRKALALVRQRHKVKASCNRERSDQSHRPKNPVSIDGLAPSYIKLGAISL